MLAQVGDFSPDQTHITVSGLRPRTFYNIRVRATNPAGFASIGPHIRLRTNLATKSESDDEAGADVHERAVVHATSTPSDFIAHSQGLREVGGLPQTMKRTATARRGSPAASGGEQGCFQMIDETSSEEDDSPDLIHRLTERLEALRAEIERVDRETCEEEQEVKRYITELTEERDHLKQEFKQKEDMNSDLRKHGNYLDRVHRAAQSKKSAREKQLYQKKVERKKLQDEIVRWEKEIVEMKQDTEAMVQEKVELNTANEKMVADIKKGIDDDLIVIKSLEEEIRVVGGQIKDLEKEQESIACTSSDDQEQLRLERENERIWESKIQAMQTQFHTLWQALHQAEMEKQQAEEELAWWAERRALYPNHFGPTSYSDTGFAMHRNRSRRSRQNNSRTSTISSPSSSYQGGPIPFNNPTISPSFGAASPYFNFNNGSSLASGPERSTVVPADTEFLTGDALISPAAGNLLPSNLLQEDDAPLQQDYVPAGLEQAGHTNADIFLGHVPSNSDASVNRPQTPISSDSRANSIFSSPRDSLLNLHGHHSRPDQFAEGDRPTSTSARFNPSETNDSSPLAHSKLVNLFSNTFRPRGKPGNSDPPLLGTLKQGQSQSFPRNLEDNPDSGTSRRRRGSYGNWANPMATLLNRNAEEHGLISARTAASRRSRLNMFGSKFDGDRSAIFVDQASSSRPSSTYSFDPVLGRSSSDNQSIGWPMPENMANRSSPLGGNWNAGPWSRAPSRRSSVQHGSTSNLSLGSTPLGPEGYHGFFLKKHSSDLAPIGTRPQSSQRPVTPKLNPAAPSFKTLFAKKVAKAERFGSKAIEKAKEKDDELSRVDDAESNEDSPPNPRLSRDAQSITTAASTTDSHDSFDRSTSGTPSEAVTPSGPRETLMQKITRKSSSSKFNVPWSKERGLFSKRSGEPSTPGEFNEDVSSEVQLGRSAESPNSMPLQEKASKASLSWTNIRRKSKKGDQSLSEAAEKSSDADTDADY